MDLLLYEGLPVRARIVVRLLSDVNVPAETAGVQLPGKPNTEKGPLAQLSPEVFLI